MSPDQLAALHAACFTVPRPWSAQEFTEALAAKGSFLATSAQGFVLGRAVAGEAELLTICVDPAARGQGQGAALMAGFAEKARALGAEAAFLEVECHNAAALALYARAGWAEAGRRKRYYHHPDGRATDALILTLALV